MAKPSNKSGYTRAKPAQKTSTIIVAAILLLVLTAVVLWVPGAKETLYDALGINQKQVSALAEIESATKVHIIDVGQGDAALLEQNGMFALIDAGPPEGRDQLLGYLEGAGVTRLEYVVMTHPHADHIGNMQAVVERYPVGTVLLPDLAKAPVPTTKTFENLLASLLENEIPTQTMALDAVYPLGVGSISVLQEGVETQDNYNLLSPVLLFEADGLRFVNTGDAEKINENTLLENGRDASADIFLAGHHGSSTSNTPAFLQHVAPEVVVISCAEDNKYGHPHREVMQLLEEQNTVVLRTDIHGSIVFGINEEGVVYAVSQNGEPAGQTADAA